MVYLVAKTALESVVDGFYSYEGSQPALTSKIATKVPPSTWDNQRKTRSCITSQQGCCLWSMEQR